MDVNTDCPETAAEWIFIDNNSLRELALQLVQDIYFDLSTKDRNNVSGLRMALSRIADMI